MIKGGYYLKPRRFDESEIAHAPPHVREVWDWLIRNAIWSEKGEGKLKRGQLFCNAAIIREGLHWYVGYRKEYYKTSACENSMKWLVKAGMITTTRTTRGSIVTICNYSLYQDPDKYESRSESRSENPDETGMKPDDRKEGIKRDKELNTPPTPPKGRFDPNSVCPIDVDLDLWREWMDNRKKQKAQNTERALQTIISELNRLRAKGHDPNTLVETANSRGWKTIYEPRGNHADTTDPFERSLAELRAAGIE